MNGNTRFHFGCLLAAVCCWLIAAPLQAASPKEIYRKAGPAVVLILASQESSDATVGTGSIIRPDGLVITNAHVLKKERGAKLRSNVWIYLKPERLSGDHKRDLSLRRKAKILAYDLSLDLALLQIQEVEPPLPVIDFADSEQIVVGDKVFAIGHPEQGGLWSLTTGVISAQRLNFAGIPGKNMFQTDASINRGNSGGPLLNDEGRMVGINAMIARKAKDGTIITDVNYSIMSNVAQKWLADQRVKISTTMPADRSIEHLSEPVDGDSEPAAPQQTIPPQNPVPTDREQPPATPGIAPPEPKGRPETPEHAEEEPVERLGVEGEPQGQMRPPLADSRTETDEGRILTEKKPYRTDRLVEEIREMEDLMEEMRTKIRRYKKNP